MKRILIIFGLIALICGATFAQQSNLVPFQIPLDGRLISSLDPTKIINVTTGGTPQISNFSTLTNMEYTDSGIRSIRGMSTITTSSLSSHPLIHNMFQFVKADPVAETHVLVQARNSGETESRVFVHSTDTPNTGTFTPTSLHTDASGFGVGRFSNAPGGNVIYCNEVETQIWGGNESKPGYFSIFDGTDPGSDTAVWSLDYTEKVWNNLTDSENVATLKRTDFPSYNIGVGSVTCWVVNNLPIQGVKFYVQATNTNTGTTQVHYWNGSTLTAVTGLSDGTASGGIPLAQTGIISFDSTESTAKVKIIDGIYGYFYRFIFPDATDTATISQVTIDVPFQDLVDFWDEKGRTILSAVMLDQEKFVDFTTNVFKEEFTFDSSTGFDEATYLKIAESGVNDFVPNDESIFLGWPERMQGFKVKMIPGKTNDIADTVMTVRYWDGDSWETVSNLDDGSASKNITFSNDGNITWTPLEENIEFKTIPTTGTFTPTIRQTRTPLYYYKVDLDKTLVSTDLFVYYISGIPAQRTIENYKFSLNAQGRVFLFNDLSSERNKIMASNVFTANTFNGDDTGDPIYVGNDEGIQAAVEIHSRTTAGSDSHILILKNNATYLLIGNNPENWDIITVSDRIGCNAPLTLVASSVGLEFQPLQSKQVAIWQGSGGIYLWDSTSIIPISDPISNYFDQTRPEAIGLNKVHLSQGFFEVHDGNHYYHYLFSSKATATNNLDTELCFDLKRQAWYEVDRQNKPLQTGTHIVSTSTGATYAYGAIDTGNLMRLNHGTSFDGNSITSEFYTADIPLSGNVVMETKLRYLRLITRAKATTSNTISVEHFTDGEDSGQTWTMSPARSGYRIAMPIVSRNKYGTFHRFKFSISTTDEDVGFEPYAISGWFQPFREVHQ